MQLRGLKPLLAMLHQGTLAEQSVAANVLFDMSQGLACPAAHHIHYHLLQFCLYPFHTQLKRGGRQCYRPFAHTSLACWFCKRCLVCTRATGRQATVKSKAGFQKLPPTSHACSLDCSFITNHTSVKNHRMYNMAWSVKQDECQNRQAGKSLFLGAVGASSSKCNWQQTRMAPNAAGNLCNADVLPQGGVSIPAPHQGKGCC